MLPPSSSHCSYVSSKEDSPPMSAELQIRDVLATPINEAIEKETVETVLGATPFIKIPGTFNVRQLRGIKESIIRPGYIFRSGTLEKTDEASFDVLRDLGIKTIFDLRSLKETTGHPDPVIPGIKIVWHPSTVDHEVHQNFQAKVAKDIDLNTMYANLLESHRASFLAVFRHVLEHPEQPLLFHCTAGKDRTGVLAALVLSLAGASIEEIERDFALTRIGIEPVRVFLLSKLAGGGKVDLEDPRVKAAGSFPENAMEGLLREITNKYGDVPGCVEHLGFSRGEVDRIHHNLTNEAK